MNSMNATSKLMLGMAAFLAASMAFAEGKSAEAIMKDAQARAKAEKKMVFVRFDASW
jgi:hypothetical protein